MRDTIVCALATAPAMIRGSSFDRMCGVCGKRVMIAPSGQKLLRSKPDLEILCSGCFVLNPPKGPEIDVPGSPEEIAAELSAIVPNLYRKRN